MSLQINRRAFLQGLIAAGASYVLPVKATKAQIDQLWVQAQAEPWYFEVNEHGTLIESDAYEPQIWSDVYDIVTSGFTTPDSIIEGIESSIPLTSHLNGILQDEIESLEEDLEQDPPQTKKEKAALQKKIETLKVALEVHDDPWIDWVEAEGKGAAAKFKKLVDDWLSDPIDWMQSEFFPVHWGSQGAALGFFQDQPYELLKDLGVVVVEGEHPGSSYYAAELRGSIVEANATAERLGLPFRFKVEAV